VRVLAAEAEPLYRDAVVRAIRERPELELVASARDAREALDAIGTSRPDVADVGGTLDGLSGQQLLIAVARDGLATRVVMIAARPEPNQVYGALAEGAAGYLTRAADARELCDAITAVARGQTVLSRELQDAWPRRSACARRGPGP
jgi:two-component system nitrate/nitrite response regulator NarL